MIRGLIILAVLTFAHAAITELPQRIVGNNVEHHPLPFIHPKWMYMMLQKFGFTKPPSEEFSAFARQLGVVDPEVIGKLRAVYDEPALLIFISDAPSGVRFNSFAERGFNDQDTNPASKVVLLDLLKKSSTLFVYGEKKEDGILHKVVASPIQELVPSESFVPTELDSRANEFDKYVSSDDNLNFIALFILH